MIVIEDEPVAAVATVTGQSEPLPNRTMVRNSAGGMVFEVNDLTRLRRFLCLGAEGGTAYIKAPRLAQENAMALMRMLAAGQGPAAVAEIEAWSVEGRAAKQGPLLFALAVCARLGDAATKAAAYASLPRVCRIPTHLFAFIGHCETLSGAGTGWGRAHRRAVAAWYTAAGRPAASLAMLVTKYQTREGWAHKDVLRLCHAVPATPAQALVFRYVAKGWRAVAEAPAADAADAGVLAVHAFLGAVEAAKAAPDEDAMAALIAAHRLAREHVPTRLLRSPVVWEALLAHMPMTALLRNLAAMTSIGVLAPGGEATATVCARLTQAAALRAARVHPFNVLVAGRTYARGRGDKGGLVYEPVPEVVAALDAAFYAAFAAVEPTGRRYVLGVDVSGSMGGGQVLGANVLTARDAAAAMALVTLRTEPACTVMAFTGDFVPLPLAADMTLETAIDVTTDLPFGPTDCAQPMLWALEHGVQADVFVVYTDCETWCGGVHPAEALRRYREATGIAAQLVVMAFTSNGFSIADPEDAGMLDMPGFDASGPEILRNFVLGRL